MERPNIKINVKKIVFTAIGIFLVVLVFVSLVLIGKDKKDEIKKPAVSVPFKKRTAEEIMKDLSAPPKTEEASETVSREVMNSLTAPAKASSVSVSESRNNVAQPAPVLVPKEVMMNLTAPTK